MRIPSTAAGLLLVLLLAPAGFAQGVEIRSGQKLTGYVEPSGVANVFRFEAVDGDQLTLSLIAKKKEGLDPVVLLLDPAGDAVPLPDVSKGKLKLKKHPITQTGSYYISVTRVGTTSGSYKLALKLKGAKVPTMGVAVPGTYEIDAPRGGLLSLDARAPKGEAFAPTIVSLVDPYGHDVLDPASVAAGKTGVKLKKQPLPVLGTWTVTFGADGEGGTASVKAKIKAGKASPKKLGPDDLVECGLFKMRSAEGWWINVWVDGHVAADAVVVMPDGTETSIPESDGILEIMQGYATQDDLNAAWPDGLYHIRYSAPGVGPVEIPAAIERSWPDALSLTSGPPNVAWTGGGGNQGFYLSVEDPLTGEDVFGAMYPSTATGVTLPPGLVPPGFPYSMTLVSLSNGRKASVAMDEAEGEEIGFKGAVSYGDLLAYDLDAAEGRYSYEVLEGLNAGRTGTGSLEPAEGWGGYVFSALDDGDPPERATDLVLLPGKLVLGQAGEGAVFAAVPAPDTTYDATEIEGAYNWVELTCSIGGDCGLVHGTFELLADGTFKVWIESENTGAPFTAGSWNDRGDGVIELIQGQDKIANLMVLPAAGGGRFLVIDQLTDHGIILAVRKEALVKGAFDGTYAALETGEDSAFPITVSGTTVRVPGEPKPLSLKLNTPWAGFAMIGDEQHGAVLILPSPEGLVFFGSSWPGDSPGEPWYSSVGVGILQPDSD